MKRIGVIVLLACLYAGSLFADEILERFVNEPTIKEVQREAISYAEVHPKKIAGWRKRANICAILPRVSLGLDRTGSDTYEIYTSSSNQYAVQGPRKKTDGWDITLTWDLTDLIWNGNQTLIDVRSRLMVKLRNEILDKVTRYYFERKKLQVELLQLPQDDKRSTFEKELRVAELTANIDLLTGGFFSKKVNINKRK